MAIEGLKIIGETLNDSIPRTHQLYENNDIEGLKNIARKQDRRGASYIDLNVGLRSPEFMAEMVKHIQGVTSKPLSIDTPDFEIARAAMQAYDFEKANGQLPILNSISPLRKNMFELFKIGDFIPILMVSEKLENGQYSPNTTIEETLDTAKYMHSEINQYKNISNENIIFDVGIAPIGSDTEGMTKRTIGSIKAINADDRFENCHMSVGLSNFTVMLPNECSDGTPVKSSLESAFLTITTKYGLDMIIGSTKRKYKILDGDHPAMKCLRDVLELEGFDILMRLQQFYS